MQKRVYVRTSVIRYLTARPSRDLIVAAHREITRQWWETERAKYELCAPEVVLREARAGHREAAEQRIDFLKVFNFFEISAEVDTPAREIPDRGAMPRQAALDALHVAVAAWHGADICSPGTAATSPARMSGHHIDAIWRGQGSVASQLCTSEELMEE